MVTTFDDIYETVSPMVAVLSKRYGGSHRKYGADHEDFSQELLLWCHKNSRRIGRWLEDEGEGMVYRALENECRDYGVDIKAQAGGQDRQSAYWYTEGELRDLLDVVFDEDKWIYPPTHDDGSGGRSVADPAHGNNWVTTLADVTRALNRIDPEQATLLREFHDQGFSNRDLAVIYGVSEPTMSRLHDKAVKALLEALGGPAPKPMKRSDTDPVWRGRHAVSNGRARAMTDNTYDE